MNRCMRWLLMALIVIMAITLMPVAAPISAAPTRQSSTPTFQTATVSTLAGVAGDARVVDGVGTAARFNQPGSIAISSDGSFALMADGENSVRRINLTTGGVTTIADLPPSAGGDLISIAISPDRTYALLTRSLSCVVQRIDLQTNAVTTITGQLGICPSPVVDGVGTQARFYRPRGIAFAPTGQYALVVDSSHIRRLDLQTRAVTTIIGAGDFAGPVDGVGTAARLGTPVGIAISADGTFALLTEGFYLHSIRRINLQTNQVTTIAGPTNIISAYPNPNAGSVDGVGIAARFNIPQDVAISRDGRFALVSDFGNHTIRRIDLQTNAVTTVAGRAGTSGTANGAGIDARFASPRGIALSPDTTFALVADMNGKTIRKLTDSSVAAPTGRTAILVIGSARPTAGDTVLRDRLQALGFNITVVEDTAATALQATSASLVVITGSATPADVNTKFRDALVPVVVLNPELFDDMGMTGSNQGTNFGTIASQTQTTITSPTNPLAGGKSGTITILNQAETLGYAQPGAGAVTVTTVSASDNRAVLFSYAPGAIMATTWAPARRVGFGLPDASAALLSPDGLTLINAIAQTTAFPAPSTTAGTGSITGRVLVDGTSTGRSNIEVCAAASSPDNPVWRCDFSAITDATGTYRIANLPAGSYQVIPVPPGFQPIFPRTVFVTVGSSATQQNFRFVSLQPQPWVKTEEIAHRGDRVSSPENTHEAFKRAVEKGASQIELDVLLAGDNSTVLIAHGSNYQAEPGNYRDLNPRDLFSQFPLSQVYGPTPVCVGLNLETVPNPDYWRTTCDIGTQMMILPGQPLGTTWEPKFRNERYQRLDDVIRAFPNYCGWMVELKETEHPDPRIDRSGRNRLLGQRVQEILQQTGALTRCTNKIWVTSFEDTTLDGITDPRIRRMRTISSIGPEMIPVVPLQWRAWIDGAAHRGYEAVNVPVQSLNTPVNEIIIPAKPGSGLPNIPLAFGATLRDYVRRSGLQLSTYSIPEITPALNQEAIDGKADFFMTDIIDDLMVRNGDRNPAHRTYTENLRIGDRLLIRNDEVFDVLITFTNGGSTALPGEAWFIGELTNLAGRQLKGEIIYPEYFKPYYEPVYRRNGYQVRVSSSGPISLNGRHLIFDNVDPKLTVSNLGADQVRFNANGVVFSQPNRENPAITGTECAPAGETKVKNIALRAQIEIPPGTVGDPLSQWKLENVQVFLDNQLFASDPGGGRAVLLPVGGPVVRDLEAGPHTFEARYTARNIANPAITRQVTQIEVFEAKLKPCLNNADIVLVFDSSGSIGEPNFDIMRRFGVSLTDALTVSNTAAKIGIVNYSNSASTALAISDNATTIKNTIGSMPYIGGGTNTADGITKGQAALTGSGARPDRPNIMIVLTDGASNDQGLTLAAARGARAAGTTIVAVGIGAGPDNAELRGMASSPGLVFTPGRFEDLIYVLEALVPASQDPIP